MSNRVLLVQWTTDFESPGPYDIAAGNTSVTGDSSNPDRWDVYCEFLCWNSHRYKWDIFVFCFIALSERVLFVPSINNFDFLSKKWRHKTWLGQAISSLRIQHDSTWFTNSISGRTAQDVSPACVVHHCSYSHEYNKILSTKSPPHRGPRPSTLRNTFYTKSTT